MTIRSYVLEDKVSTADLKVFDSQTLDIALPVGHGFLFLLAVSPRKVAELEAGAPPICMVFEFHYIMWR